jgi:hypothetical protein
VFGSVVQAGTKAVGGDRFSLVNLMPIALLVGFLGFLAASGLYTSQPFRLPVLKDVGSNAGWVVLAVFGVFVLAVVLRPFEIALVYVLEGYWRRWQILDPITDLAIEQHRRRLHTAQLVRDAEDVPPDPQVATLRAIAEARRARYRWASRKAGALRVADRYPNDRLDPARPEGTLPTERLMPTMLGNALRQAEDEAGDRYGLDLPAIAPRLYPFISDKLGGQINRNLDLIESGAALCVTFALGAAATAPLISRPDPWRLVPLIGAVLSILTYRGTLQTARGHGRLLATAVDLHRFDMIAALRYPLRTDPVSEYTLNCKISAFLRGGSPASSVMRDTSYVHPDPTVPSGTGAGSGAGVAAVGTDGG